MAVIALRRKDRTEFFCTGQAQKIGFKDYVDVISHNRAIQMLVIRLVASRVVHTAFWSTAGSWACSICLSAGRVSALHSLWLTS